MNGSHLKAQTYRFDEERNELSEWNEIEWKIKTKYNWKSIEISFEFEFEFEWWCGGDGNGEWVGSVGYWV